MTFEIDRSSKVPVYAQIADWIEEQMRTGVFREGSRLPSERELCRLTGTARNTVKRAYEELEKRGCIVTEQNSGSYVENRDLEKEMRTAERKAADAAVKLRDQGLTWHEIDHAFLDSIWKKLPETEKVRVAWVDCSVEILKDTAREIEKACNVRVVPFLLDDVRENCSLLTGGEFDAAATTINHYDELRHLVEKTTGAPPAFYMDMAVLAVSRMTVSQLARIEEDMRVVVVYAAEWYRYSLECYLKEFSVKGHITYVTMEKAMDFLQRNTDKKAVILPQDLTFLDGYVGRLYEYCMARDIFCLVFQQIIDAGSLLHIKRQIQRLWIRQEEPEVPQYKKN